MVAFTKHDLQFILEGIEVSQSHADQTNDTTGGTWNQATLEASRQVLLDLVPNSFEPIGMRTITGELNNLIQGNEEFGATGEFPRLTDPSFRDDGLTGNPADGTAFGPGTNTDYSDPGTVVDSDPRIISNLIVDQSVRNPAAIAAAEASAGLDGLWGSADDELGDGVSVVNPDGVAGTGDEFFKINNVAPDEGLSAPFNAWFTFFGQFFDHGLDLIKRGDERVFIPLQADDPLVTLGPDGIAGTGDEVAVGTPQIISRVAVDPGLDGILGTDDDSQPINLTSPFVDQNQTYTSHPSHQLFMREYELDGSGNPVSTGKMLEGAGGGLASWGEVKAQAATVLGIELTDLDGLDIPLFAVDQYGDFLPSANGLPQFVMSDGTLVEGNLTTPVSLADAVTSSGVAASTTGISFLVDIAHAANPKDSAGNNLTRHEDGDAGDGLDGGPGTYDGDLFDAHLLSGDGRSNENIGLTSVHHVFHSEHNRVADHTKEVLVIAAGSDDVPDALALLNGYLTTPEATFTFVDRDAFASDAAFDAAVDAAVLSLDWDGDAIFQAAKFATEMQYQHLVFEEFGRKVQPLIDLFASFEGEVDAKIVGEFAHTVYRFGHSMLTENVDHIDAAGNLTEAGLIAAFLNPLAFHQEISVNGITGEITPGVAALDADAAAGAIIRGLTREVGNEIDEFVTEALRNNLVGLPLDLAAINIARGRETGVPTLNEARAEFFEGTGDTKLKPYESWVDFAGHLKHEESIINFIASYGQHSSITGATTLADKRDAALQIATGVGGSVPVDRLDFLNSTNAWATQETGLNLVDLWIGGLAESIEPFGGVLGSTFNFVFEDQMERLQDGDRFYYLGRVAGLNFISQLEQNSFANMIIRNTDIGDGLGDHLPGDIFSVPNYILEVNEAFQITNLAADGVTELVGGNGDPIDPSPVLNIPLVIRDNPNTAVDEDLLNTYLEYTGGDHVVLGGSSGNDTLIGGVGDDTLWGGDGDDNLEGGDGGDIILGGEGDDVITDIGGPNNLQGQGGNDAIFAGGGESLILAGDGKDFVLQGPDLAETFGGQGDDFIHAGSESNIIFGNEGNDWLEGGGGNNLLIGDNGDPFLNSTITGHDVFIPGEGDDDYDAESGDDIMLGGIGVQRFEGTNGFDWATYFRDVSGVEADMLLRAFDETPIPPSPATIQDRFAEVEGLSGSQFSDILRGENTDGILNRNANNGGDNVLRNFDLIQGLREGDFGGAFNATALFAAGTAEWGEGDIILGGGGSDLIEGRGGDDMIDGDLALGVRLLVRDAITDAPIATADGMHGTLFAVNPDGTPALDLMGQRIPVTIGTSNTLNEAIFARDINPGNLHIVREILDQGTASDFDTAQYSDVLANYTISAPDALGFITVSHNSAPGITDGLGVDGVDLVRDIERLQFADQNVVLVPGINFEPTGAPGIVDNISGLPDTTPDVDQVLRATPGVFPDNIADGNGIASAILFTWQVELEPGTGVFTDIIAINAGGDEGPVTGELFTVPQDLAGLALRVKATFVDGIGVIETLFSAPTDATGGLAVTLPTNGDDILVGTGIGETIEGLAGDDEINGGAGNDILIGGDDFTITNPPGVPSLGAGSNNAGNDILDGGAGIDTALFFGLRSEFDFVLDVDGNLEVVEIASGEEDLILNIEFLEFDDEIVTFADAFASAGGGATPGDDILNGTPGDDLINGLAGNDTINGLGGADELIGGLGMDTLNGDGGADTLDGGADNDTLNGGNGGDDLTGGTGNDTINGDNGSDTIFWEARSAADTDGRDIVDGGNGGGDRLRIQGSDDDETYFIETVADYNARVAVPDTLTPTTDIVVSRAVGAAISTVIMELDRIEDIDINGGGGNDTFIVSGNFNNTDLDPNTITIDSGSGNNILDISGLTSDHKVVYNANGDEDMVIGELRDQDIYNLEDGDEMVDNGDGSYTIKPKDDDDDDDGNGNGDHTNDEVHGDDGDDYVYGGEGDDDVYGDDGDDYVFGNGGNDYVSGGDGNDYVYGDDYIPMDYNPGGHNGGHGGGCGTGCDTGHGGGHNGGGGGTYRCGKNEPKPEPKCDKPAPCDKDGYSNDYNGQYGLMGSDVIYGGAGDDMMYGGDGADLFIYKPGEGYDTIADFQPGYDEIKFEGDDKPFTVNYYNGGMEFDFGDGNGLKVNYADNGYGNGGGCQPCTPPPCNPCCNQDNGDIWS